MAPGRYFDEGDLPPPPPHPPRLLNDEQIIQFAQQGHLPLKLPGHLAALYAQLDAVSNDFFALPLEAKQELYPPHGQSELGFIAIPGEKDYVTFRAHSHGNQESNLEQLVASVWRETFVLFERVLGDLSYGLNMDHRVWRDVVGGDGPIPQDLEDATPTFLRIFRYAADKGIAEKHTDMGLLTLCVCQGKGLQVLDRKAGHSEAWTEYDEPTLLIGQTLSMLSGGILKSGVHRVVSNSGGRGSIVFALRPSTTNTVDLSVFPGKRNQIQGVMHMGDLWKSIWSKSFNVNAPKEAREKQKQQLKLTKSQYGDSQNQYDITNTKAAFEL